MALSFLNLTITEMNKMKILSRVVGLVDCNCYILQCEDTKECVVIDVGGSGEAIADLVNSIDGKVIHILCTHGHFDHLMGLSDFVSKIPAPISIHEADYELYKNMGMQGEYFQLPIEENPKCNHFLKDGEELKFGRHTIKVLHTPGHTQGGVCFLVDNNLFSGDTLFRLSIGRTDLPGGSYKQLIDSIKTKLFVLPDEIKVYPGHEGETLLGFEKKHNMEIM